MATIATFDDLVRFLTDSEIPYHADAALQVVVLPSNVAPLPGNLYVKWEKGIPFLQLLRFMIEDVSAERVRELETAIVRLDNRLEVGGFQFDHDRRRLHCRLTVPVFAPEGISSTTFIRLCDGVVANAKTYVAAFAEIVRGSPGDQIIAICEDLEKRRAEDASSVVPP